MLGIVTWRARSLEVVTWRLDVRPGHTQRSVGVVRLFRSGSQICGPFNRHNQVAIGAESFPRYRTKTLQMRGFCLCFLTDNKVQNRPWGKLWGKVRSK